MGKGRLVALGLLFVMCAIVGTRAARWEGSWDTRIYHLAAQQACERHYELVYSRDRQMLAFLYGPVFLNLSSPLCLVKPNHLGPISIAIHLACYLLLWWSLGRLFPYLNQDGGWRWWIVFMFSISPIHLDFQGQNIQLPLAAILIFAEVLSRSKHATLKFISGVLVALAALVKIFPIFVAIYYVVGKRAHARTGVLLGGLVFALIPFATYGISGGWLLYSGFLQTLSLGANPLYLIENLGALSLPSLAATWLVFMPFVARLQLVYVIQAIVSLAFFYSVYRYSRRESDNESILYWAMTFGLMSLFNSGHRQDYMIFYLPVVAAVFDPGYILNSKRVYTALILFGVSLVALTTDFVVGRLANDFIEGWRIPVLGVGVLVGCLWWLIRRLKLQSNPLPAFPLRG